MNILTDVTSYVKFLVTHKLSTNQFLLLYLLYTEKMIKVKSGRISYAEGTCIYKWQSKGKGWNQLEIEDLVSKDYIIAFKKSYEIEPSKKVYGYAVDDVILTSKFSDIMFIAVDQAFEEILDLYPDTFIIEGPVFTKTGDLDKLSEIYAKLIKNSVVEHEKMKELIIFAKERNLCKMKLITFLSRGVIDPIKKMMEDTFNAGSDI